LVVKRNYIGPVAQYEVGLYWDINIRAQSVEWSVVSELVLDNAKINNPSTEGKEFAMNLRGFLKKCFGSAKVTIRILTT